MFFMSRTIIAILNYDSKSIFKSMNDCLNLSICVTVAYIFIIHMEMMMQLHNGIGRANQNAQKS
jgi:hypothetical protein